MNVICKYCRAEIKPDNINREIFIARCTQCNAVFEVTTQWAAVQDSRFEVGMPPLPTDPTATAAPRPRPTVTLPSNYTLTRENGQLVVTRMWFSWAVLSTFFF